jgi:hypothetical protein
MLYPNTHKWTPIQWIRLDYTTEKSSTNTEMTSWQVLSFHTDQIREHKVWSWRTAFFRHPFWDQYPGIHFEIVRDLSYLRPFVWTLSIILALNIKTTTFWKLVLYPSSGAVLSMHWIWDWGGGHRPSLGTSEEKNSSCPAELILWSSPQPSEPCKLGLKKRDRYHQHPTPLTPHFLPYFPSRLI